MSNKIHTMIISVISVVFLFAAMAFARTKQIDVLYPATVGKTLKLKPGNYKIDVVNSQKSHAVQFYNQEGKMVGEAPVKMVNKSRKNEQTRVDYSTVASNDHVITEISPGGWKENLLFFSPTTSKVDSKN